MPPTSSPQSREVAEQAGQAAFDAALMVLDSNTYVVESVLIDEHFELAADCDSGLVNFRIADTIRDAVTRSLLGVGRPLSV